jgi:hypothetical protein
MAFATNIVKLEKMGAIVWLEIPGDRTQATVCLPNGGTMEFILDGEDVSKDINFIFAEIAKVLNNPNVFYKLPDNYWDAKKRKNGAVIWRGWGRP